MSVKGASDETVTLLALQLSMGENVPHITATTSAGVEQKDEDVHPDTDGNETGTQKIVVISMRHVRNVVRLCCCVHRSQPAPFGVH